MQFYARQSPRRRRYLPVATAALAACTLVGAHFVTSANAAPGDPAATATVTEAVEGVTSVTGEGFTAESSVLIYVSTTVGSKEGRLTANADGNVSADVRLPDGYSGPVDVMLLSDDNVVNKLLFDATGELTRDEENVRIDTTSLSDPEATRLLEQYEEFDRVMNELNTIGGDIKAQGPDALAQFLTDLGAEQADMLVLQAQAEQQVLENGSTEGSAELIAAQNTIYEDMIERGTTLLEDARAQASGNQRT